MAKAKRKKRTVARKRKPVRRKRVKRVAAKKMPRKRRKSTATKKRKPRKRQHLVKQVERSSVERVLTGRKRRKGRKRRPARRRKVIMAGTHRRSRSVGKKGGMGMLLAVGAGALAVYLLTRPKTPTYPTYPNYPQLPPLNQTSNYQRNDQTNSILNYALAAGLAVDAITKLIDRLNNSDDQEIKNIYDHVDTTGNISAYV